ncbi:hypothetical protein [Legionella micdadei]|uniref:Regulator of chromosome condensation (RCC1) repeat-containing protein n=1 Tax=Legionella micdadei TaxID=451 RepID=A0A098GBZ6_LEGMI|nr:hypothetical protein [Legionella micdadei]ARG98306.1 hypothetical protein B6N58_11890 [Legionella micdadei]ARH01057.1 hypothetical protein B6V88_11900 [Legionella micdadei]KTD27237.1 Regulator of chromosome condensation (RCC1) repeat protein [Legionella micdadei]NSL18624.1 hypothetical protein [Legionella micdadei]CEG60023.1 protein of unknown function [Regulator of chromosome condensation, RCC1] [Legionella micdadei]
MLAEKTSLVHLRDDDNLFARLPIELQEMIWDKLPVSILMQIQRVNTFFQQKNYKEYLLKRLDDFFTIKQQTYFHFTTDHILLFTNGLVAACGSNFQGKLGLGDVEQTEYPMFIKTLSKQTIIKVCLGGRHSVYLDDKGQVWVCGDNEDGQLGVGESVTQVAEPICLSNLPFITDIYCGLDYTLFKDRDNQLFFCGSNYNNFASLELPKIFLPTMISPETFAAITWELSTGEQSDKKQKKDDFLELKREIMNVYLKDNFVQTNQMLTLSSFKI